MAHDNGHRPTTFSLQLASPSETSIDPVCGMTVDPATAAGSHAHAGMMYHFCSRHCLEKFKADPEKYLGAKAPESCCGQASAPAIPSAYTCPMHPGVARIAPEPARSAAWRLEPMIPQAGADSDSNSAT